MEFGISLGIIYMVIGVAGSLINLTAAVLMATDKEMRHATYVYMIQLCICDCIVLIFSSVYGGLSLIWPVFLNETATGISGYSTGIGWYAGSSFMVLIAFSRCVQLVWSHKIEYFFSKFKVRMSIVAVYLCPAIFYMYNAIRRPLIFYVSTTTCTWVFNTSDQLGKVMSILNIASNLAYAFVVTGLNIRTLHWVRKTRKQIHTLENKQNQKREIKLFFQCAITGTFYTAAVVLFFIISTMGFGGQNVWAHVLVQVGWMIEHFQNPLIYFAINARLRGRVVRVLTCKDGPHNSNSTNGHAPVDRVPNVVFSK